MKGYIILVLLAFTSLHSSIGSLVVKGPTEPVLEGEDVTLECVDTESKLNISSVHFERLSKYMRTWFRLESEDVYLYRRCFLYDVSVKREEGKLFVQIPNIQSWSDGPYRCVVENSSAPDNSSESFTIPVHYMREVAVHRTGLGYLTRYYSAVQELKVRLGDDVELECSTSASEKPDYFWTKEGEVWVMPVTKLKLEKVKREDGGRYTCTAQSPTVESLMKKRTISITVLPEDAAWYESTTGQVYLICAVGLVVLVIAISMITYLCRRAKQNNCKGPIDDRSQKKPIYKSSVESLPSTSSDSQPLV
ncbi:vascular endothelial growth factor receptor 3 [Misgurnus anguillicaudatus]|uniref:vascular endothelial growth factor receptor 3 n=1 Tax=Misgurnus anguillicaudatus TaxID=75329 RepID=UPI002434A37F|nr:vascular endothelial growth factor receptor 2 [Misgurnus anguillicaudatus]